MLKRIIIIAIFTAFIAGCASTKKMADTRIGEWEYTVTGTPEGDFTGLLTISKDGDAYVGVLKTNDQETQLKNFTIEDNKLSGNFDYMGYNVNMKGVIEGETMAGEMTVEYNGFPFTATKLKK